MHKKTVHILLLEGNERDQAAIIGLLEHEGIPCAIHRVVNGRYAGGQRFNRGSPDIILVHFSSPVIDLHDGLETARLKHPETPFILVFGELGNELAVETLKIGETECILNHRFKTMGAAVIQALEGAEDSRSQTRKMQVLFETSEQLRALSGYLQYAREEERIRVSREIHDELGHALTQLKIDTVWMERRTKGKKNEMQQKLAEMSETIDATIQTVRRIATELRPGILDNLGLEAALEWQKNDFEKRSGIRCHFQSRLEAEQLDQDLNTAFFRIFQEMLTNVVRHSEATEIWIRLNQEGELLTLEVKDDGRGISGAEIHNTKSIGLLGMRERAAAMGGWLDIQNVSGAGTLVKATIPIVPMIYQARHEKNSSCG